MRRNIFNSFNFVRRVHVCSISYTIYCSTKYHEIKSDNCSAEMMTSHFLHKAMNVSCILVEAADGIEADQYGFLIRVSVRECRKGSEREKIGQLNWKYCYAFNSP